MSYIYIHEIRKRKANWIGHILRRNCLLQRVTEGKIQGGIEVTGRQGRRRKKLLDDLKERRGYSHLKEEALDRTMWRARFGRGFGPVVRQTTKWMKSPTWCNNFSAYYPDVCLQLNMFRAFSHPSSGAQWLQWQPLVLPSYRGDSLWWGRPAGRPSDPTTNTARYEGKTRGCHCSHWAPDDERENARNMLSCKQTSG